MPERTWASQGAPAMNDDLIEIKMHLDEAKRRLANVLVENRSLRATIDEQSRQIQRVKLLSKESADHAFKEGYAEGYADGRLTGMEEYAQNVNNKHLERAKNALWRISNMSYAGYASDIATRCLKAIGEIQ